MILTFTYLVILAIILFGSRRLPKGPFLLANAYDLFLMFPCALAYYMIFSSNAGINYGYYELNSLVYAWIFYFKAIVFLSGYAGYRSGFRYGVICPEPKIIHVNTEKLSYKIVTLITVISSIGILIYVHSAFGFAYIFEPRRLYEVSREGFGTHYFALGFSLRLAALLVLMSNFRRKIFLLIALLAFSVFTGAKVNTYVIVMFSAMYFIVFAKAGRLNLKLLAKLASIALPLVYLLIWLTFQDSNNSIIELLVSYVNEPWNNFTLLAQSFDLHFHNFFYGRLFWENNFISRIPRPFYPEKPYLFGGFRLADKYFPETVALGIGAPSFGSEGIAYADWGLAGLLMLIGLKWILSWILGRATCLLTYNQTSSIKGNFLYFGVLLIMADMYFFTLPPSNNLIDNLIVVIGLSLLLASELDTSKSR